MVTKPTAADGKRTAHMKILNGKLVPDDFTGAPIDNERTAPEEEQWPELEPAGKETVAGLRKLVGPAAADHPGLNVVCR